MLLWATGFWLDLCLAGVCCGINGGIQDAGSCRSDLPHPDWVMTNLVGLTMRPGSRTFRDGHDQSSESIDRGTWARQKGSVCTARLQGATVIEK